MIVRIAQLIIVLIPIALLGWLFNNELVIDGEFVTQHNVLDRSAFVDRLLPDGRVKDGNTIVDDPVFFFLHPHRDFDEIELEIVYQNNGVPIVELGGLTSTRPEAFTFVPLENQMIDASDWHRIESDSEILLQRNTRFDSIETFQSTSIPRQSIATYRTQLQQPYRNVSYHPTSSTRSINASLRGRHEFKTYIKDEEMVFTFEYMDMNREDGEDKIAIVVFNEQGQPVVDVVAQDDGNTSADSKATPMKTVTLRRPGLAEGVYKIVMNTTRDVFFRTITTTQQSMVFLNGVYLGDEIGYRETPRSVSFVTDGKRPSFQTRNAEGAQTIQVGESTLDVSEPYRLYRSTIDTQGLASVTIPQSNMEVFIDGVVAFDAAHYFQPDPVRLLYHTDVDARGIDFVLASKSSATKDGEWRRARATFQKDDLLMQDGTWKITFSTPGIAERDTSLLVKEINVTWRREPFKLQDLTRFFQGS